MGEIALGSIGQNGMGQIALGWIGQIGVGQIAFAGLVRLEWGKIALDWSPSSAAQSAKFNKQKKKVSCSNRSNLTKNVAASLL